jgi:hypothetical protein
MVWWWVGADKQEDWWTGSCFNVCANWRPHGPWSKEALTCWRLGGPLLPTSNGLNSNLFMPCLKGYDLNSNIQIISFQTRHRRTSFFNNNNNSEIILFCSRIWRGSVAGCFDPPVIQFLLKSSVLSCRIVQWTKDTTIVICHKPLPLNTPSANEC